jgi:hypothetical protein
MALDPQLKENVTARTTWIRGLFILLFAAIYSVAEILIVAVVVFQFLSTLLTARNNTQLLRLGRSLAEFIKQVLLFVTYNTEDKPFPFGPWPDIDVAAAPSSPKKVPRKTTKKQAPPEEDE